MGAGKGWDSFFGFFVQFESSGKKCYNKQQLSSLLKKWLQVKNKATGCRIHSVSYFITQGGQKGMVRIEGLQKLTLLDYPERVACTVFTGGCNFCCPFCHNGDLLPIKDTVGQWSEAQLLEFLHKRRSILDGVCITGGEPLLQKELPVLLRQIKALGYQIKLDTNGSFPDRLEELVADGLVDYVAMDIKNSLERYPETTGCMKSVLEPVKRSVDFLLQGKVPYEFRTTVVRELHDGQSMLAISQWISGAQRYFLQGFVDSEHVVQKGLHGYTAAELEQLRQCMLPLVPKARLRGIA